MFGYLRFFLAFLVMISHMSIWIYGLNPGVVAVVVFYLLAGFVVSHLFFDILPDSKYKILLFYKDRFLRIFPLYLYIAFLTTVFLLLTSFGNPDFTFKKIIYNLTIIPLNYYMYLDSTILTKPHWCLIPPTWSLGAELQAYILLSAVFIFQKAKIPLAIVSFFIYIIANFSIINPDYFGYRFIAGVFFIFFIGSSIQRFSSKKISKFERYFPLFVFLFILFLTPIFYVFDIFSPTYTKETFVGLLLGIPLVFFISKSKIKLPFNSLFGSLSYGLFLSHFLSIWILEYFDFLQTQKNLQIVAVAILSTLFSYSGIILIERKINSLRYIKGISSNLIR